jgi:hypothetical protein
MTMALHNDSDVRNRAGFERVIGRNEHRRHNCSRCDMPLRQSAQADSITTVIEMSRVAPASVVIFREVPKP